MVLTEGEWKTYILLNEDSDPIAIYVILDAWSIKVLKWTSCKIICTYSIQVGPYI